MPALTRNCNVEPPGIHEARSPGSVVSRSLRERGRRNSFVPSHAARSVWATMARQHKECAAFEETPLARAGFLLLRIVCSITLGA